MKRKKQTLPDQSIRVNNRSIALTNLDKVFWPNEQYTKNDLLNYYAFIWPLLSPYLRKRPLSLKRNPNGILDDGFYHKDAGDETPDWMAQAPIYSESTQKTVRYVVCNNKATLLYLVNWGCIEFNPWNSTVNKLEQPSYLVIDLDPSPGNSFHQVIDAALTVKDVLDKAGADSYCKTSGASGLHVYIPLGQKYSYEQARDFAKIIATLVHEQTGSFTTMERRLNKRGKRIYLDYLQNTQGQTLAAAYSVRPVEGARISTPLEWNEVKHGLDINRFNIDTMQKRIEKKGDLFEEVLGKGINLLQCLKKLGV